MEAKDTQIFFIINSKGRRIDLTDEFGRQAEVSFKAGIREAISVYEPYIKLLGQEIDTLSPLAIAHGWRSVRAEAGEKCRKEIAKLKESRGLK